MRAALSLLFLSAVLFLPCAAPAAEPAQAKIEAGVSEPSPGAMTRLFGWFKSLGNLKLEEGVAEDQSRRYQDGQYVYWNGGSKGYHFVADLTPDIQPGFYLQTKAGGALAAELSIENPGTGLTSKDEEKSGSPSNFCMFVAPKIEHPSCEVRDNGLGPDMPFLDVHPAPDDMGAGIRCGFTLKFE